MRYAYVNGTYTRHQDAVVHIEDRGFQFADGVYEVIAIHNGALVDGAAHLDRLDHSLGELSIAWPMSRRVVELVIANLVRKNGLRFGSLYLQVTRGAAPRDFPFPHDVPPTLVLTTRRLKPFDATIAGRGVAVITIPDIRWKRCDIKSVSLLAPVIGKQSAIEAGAFEAWQVDTDGLITEGTASNAWIVTEANELVTRRTGHAILSGITRARIMTLAKSEGLTYVERAFSVAEAKSAREAFLSSSNTFVKPVVKVDDAIIGDGKPGPLSLKLLEAYGAYMEEAGMEEAGA